MASTSFDKKLESVVPGESNPNNDNGTKKSLGKLGGSGHGDAMAPGNSLGKARDCLQKQVDDKDYKY